MGNIGYSFEYKELVPKFLTYCDVITILNFINCYIEFEYLLTDRYFLKCVARANKVPYGTLEQIGDFTRNRDSIMFLEETYKNGDADDLIRICEIFHEDVLYNLQTASLDYGYESAYSVYKIASDNILNIVSSYSRPGIKYDIMMKLFTHYDQLSAE